MHYLLPTLFISSVAFSASLQASPDFRYISNNALNALEKKYGVRGKNRIKQWSVMLSRMSAKESVKDKALMRLANNYFNKIHWKWDQEHWGVEDYWATPIETLGTHAGDCEDFSIGKYFFAH